MPKGPRRAADFPRCTLRLVGAKQHALAFLAEVDIRLVVDASGQTPCLAHGLHPLCDQGDFVGDQVVVLHRLYGQMHARHMADLTRPKTTAVDDLFGVDLPLWRGQIPRAVRALGHCCHTTMGEILCAINAGRLSKCVCGA